MASPTIPHQLCEAQSSPGKCMSPYPPTPTTSYQHIYITALLAWCEWRNTVNPPSSPWGGRGRGAWREESVFHLHESNLGPSSQQEFWWVSLSRTCCRFLHRDDRKALGSVSKRLFVVAAVCEGPLRQELHFIWQQVWEIVESLCNSFITSSALMVNGLVPAN